MAVDVSTLSIKVATSGIDDSTTKLDKLSTSADKAEVATKKFSTSSSSSYQAVTKELQNLQRVANTTSIVPASSGTAAAVAEIKMVTNAIAGIGKQSKKTADESKNAFQAIGSGVASMRSLLGGGLIAGTLMGITSEVIKMADSWTMMNARLQVVTGSMQAAAAAQETIFKVSQDLRVPLEATTQLYSRLIPALRAVGKSTKEAEETTRGVGLALKLSGATGAETSSVMLQFSQAMQAGRLNGAEFNAVAEGSPLILLALQDSLGKTRGELKKMGSQGKLTAEVVVDAIKNKLPEWDAAFAKLPLTVDGSMTLVANAFTKAFGVISQSTGATSAIAAGLKLMADNAQLLVNVIGVGLVTAIGYYLTKAAIFITTKTIEITQSTLLRGALIAESQAAIANALAKQKAAQAAMLGSTNSTAYKLATEQLTAAKLSLTAAEGTGVQATTMYARAIGLLTNPLTLVVVAIGAVGYALYKNRDAMVEFGDTTTSLGNVFEAFWKTTKDVFNGIYETVSKTLAAVMKTIGPYLDTIGKWLAKFFTDNKNGWIGFAEAILLYVPRALDTSIQVFTSFATSMGIIASAVVKAWVNAFDTIGTVFERAKDLDVKGILQAYKDGGLKAVSITKDLGSGLKSTWGNIGQDKGPIMSFLKDFGTKMEDNISIAKAASDQATIEEARMKAAALAREQQAAKEAKAQAAAQAKHAAATKTDTEAKDAYSKALQSVKEFQEGLNQAETTHKSLLIDINNKTRQAVDDINQKTAAIEAERKGTILTASAKIAMDAKEKQAAAEAIDLKIREQEILRGNSSMTLLEARRNYDAQVKRIEQIGTATDAESKQARAAAVNQLQFYSGEVKKHTAIEQTIGKLTAEAEAQEKISLALKLQAGAQAMLDMERVGRSLGQVLSDGFGEAAKSLGTLMTLFEDYSLQQKKIEQDKKVALEGGQDAAKVEQTYLTATAKLSAKTYADMAGASKRLLKEKTAGYKVLNAAEKAFRIYEMMMAAKSFAQKLALSDNEMVAIAAKNALALAGIAAEKTAQMGLNIIRAIGAIITQGSAGPIVGFAMMAAMAAAVIALGVSVGGGGGQAPTSAAQLQEQAGTGSIFGDLTAKSESISKSTALLEENSSLSVDLNAGMLASLKNIEASMTGFTSVIIRSGIVGDLSMNGANKVGSVEKIWNIKSASVLDDIFGGLFVTDFINKALGNAIGSIFGGKTEVTDYGITSGKQSLGSIASGGLMSKGYTNIKKSGGWFSKDKYSTTLSDLPQEVSAQFSMVVNNMRDGVLQAGKVLGMGSGFAGQLDKFVVDIGNISLKGLSSEDIQKQFSNIFSKLGDDMAKFAFGEEFLAKYQKVGEGAFETLVRVASAIATVDGLFLDLGIDVSNAFDSISMSGVDAKMQLIEFAGGLDKLASSLGSYYDKYYTDAEKQKIVADQVGSKLKAMGLSVALTGSEAENLAAFRKLVEDQQGKLDTEAGRRAYAALLEIAPTFADIAGGLAADIKAKQDAQAALTAATLNAKTLSENGGTVEQIKAAMDAMKVAQLAFEAISDPTELLGSTGATTQAQQEAANAWWEAKGGPAAVDTQQAIANGITTLNDLGAKDKTIAAMATQNAADTAATIQTLREMVAAQQTTNNILMAKIDSLTAAVADAGKKTVNAVVDSANVVTR